MIVPDSPGQSGTMHAVFALDDSVSHSFLTAWWLSHRWRGGSGAISTEEVLPALGCARSLRLRSSRIRATGLPSQASSSVSSEIMKSIETHLGKYHVGLARFDDERLDLCLIEVATGE